MVQEATQVTGTEETALPPITEQPAETPAETVVTEPVEEPEGEPAAEAPEPVRFDPERYKEDESYKEHIDTVAKASKRDGHLAALEQFQQSDTQQARILGQIQAGINGLNKVFKEQGVDADVLNEALQMYAPQLGAFKNWNEQREGQVRNQGFVNAIAFTMQKFSQEVGEDFGDKYAERFVKEIPYDGGVEAMQDWMKDTRKAIAAKVEAPLKKEIADLKTQLAGGKVASRKDGPDTAQKGGRGSVSNDYQKRLDRLSLGRDSDGNAPTDEDRAWLAARE